ncbi:hypothetical protein HYT92_02410 [Candidatus Pacearchaeota archaeon]|nr:hypothetical protein [Candidatus Pacearchaeota archaeon]
MKTTKDFWKTTEWVMALTAVLIFPGFAIVFTAQSVSKVFGDVLMLPELSLLIIKMCVVSLILLPAQIWLWEPMHQKIEKKIKQAEIYELLGLGIKRGYWRN